MSRPYAEVRLRTMRGLQQPRRLEVIQEIGKHDLAFFSNKDRSPSSPRWRTGAVAEIRYGLTPSQVVSMPAYVYESQPENNRRHVSMVDNDVTCVGLTFPMKSEGIQVWDNVKTWILVEELGRRHRIPTKVDRVGKVRDSVAQDGRSEWAMLSELATDDGLLLFVKDGTLHLRDPRLLEAEQRPVATVLALGRNLQKVRSDMGDLSPDGPSAAEYISEGFSATGGRFVDRSSSRAYRRNEQAFSTITRFETSPTHSPREGQEQLEALERRNRFVYTAEIEVVGDPEIRPGIGVYLDKVGDRVSGHWIVTKATHKIRRDSYEVVARIGRAEPFSSSPAPEFVAGRRVLVGHGADYRSSPSSRMRLVENRWVSA